MAEIGETVLLKSGGPELIITYVFTGTSSRDKAAVLKGFKKGDVVCEWQHELPNGKTKNMKRSFKAATLKYPDGSLLATGGDDDDDDDDDDW